ncbi:MAG: thiamine phosphate synthase [Thermoleophilia bacterium]|jgi:thiamine-phosphate diphosphorylase
MDFGLYVITKSVPELGRDHYDVAAAAIEGGASAIQLRIKKRAMGEALKIANAIHAMTLEAGIPLIINDHVGIAMASKAEGLHVGPDDITIPAARRMPGSEIIIGSSSGKPAEAIKAEREGASYVGVGPVYATDTKPGEPETGVARITKVKAVVGIPVIAIGGINADNIAACIEAGADGIAVVSAVCMAEDMYDATTELRQALEKARKNIGKSSATEGNR